MKNKLILSALLLCAGVSLHAQEKAAAYHLRPAIALRTTVQSDSINFKGEKFSVKDLLKTRVDLAFDSYAYNRGEADTAGYVKVEKEEQDNLLYLFATSLRA